MQSIYEKTNIFKKNLGNLVTSFEYQNDSKGRIIIAYHSIMEEHHSAILLLIDNNLNGSAFALLRSVYELLYRAHWIVGCATTKQINEMLKGKNIFPKMNEMVVKIDTAFKIDDFFQNIKKNSWGPMNDYTHSGIRQINRRFKDNNVEPDYGYGEIIEVLNGINIALGLMAKVFFAFFKQLEAEREVEKMLFEYMSSPV